MKHSALKRKLASNIPEDKRFKQFVRWGRWKCVIPVDGDPMLFDYEGDFGISEQTDVAADHPDVIESIRSYLAKARITDRRITIPSTTAE